MIAWIHLIAATAVLAGAPMDLQTLVSEAGQHAAAQEKALENIAVTTTVTQQELNGSGKVKHNSEIVSTATPIEGGKKKYAIVKAFEDGHDIGQEESKKMRMAVAGSDKPGEGRIDNPFLPGNQGKYHFWLIGPDPKHPGWMRVGFGPSGRPDVNLVAGEAVIDQDGYVRHVEQRPSAMPGHMQEISMSLDYSTPSPWGPLRTQMNVEGKGRIFYFFHRQVKGSVKYQYALPGNTAPKSANDGGTDAGTPASAPADAGATR